MNTTAATPDLTTIPRRSTWDADLRPAQARATEARERARRRHDTATVTRWLRSLAR